MSIAKFTSFETHEAPAIVTRLSGTIDMLDPPFLINDKDYFNIKRKQH